MNDPRLEAVRQLVEPLLAEESAELVELGMHRHRGHVLVRLLVDRVGGVTIQHCTRLNRLVGDALDQSGLIDERYTLEVSSPGLDRPLVSKRDYERAIGEPLDVQVGESPQGAKLVKGMLLSVQEHAIVLTTSTGNTTIPFAQIQAARKQIRFHGDG